MVEIDCDKGVDPLSYADTASSSNMISSWIKIFQIHNSLNLTKLILMNNTSVEIRSSLIILNPRVQKAGAIEKFYLIKGAFVCKY